MYTPLRPSSSKLLPIRHMRYHVRSWGTARTDVPPLVLLHGWMDVSASYQFVVDALPASLLEQRLIIAPDWRGFGRSIPPLPSDHYHFADYLGDLDALLAHYAPNGQAVDLVGHSMGGNIAMLYAGARPQRIRRLVNLEGFGLPETQASQAPQRMGQWLDELQSLHQGGMQLSTYDDMAAVAARLQKNNRRLPLDKAMWLSSQWAAPNAEGRWAVLGDAAHKITNPQLFRLEELLAHYAAITAPVLAVHASDDSLGQWWKGRFSLAQYHARLQTVPNCRIAQVPDAGHMLHHDQPQLVAQHIAQFCSLTNSCS